MIFVSFLLFISLPPTFGFERHVLESVNQGYDFFIKEFVVPRLPNVLIDLWESIELWSRWSHLFSLPKQKVHVLLYRCTREVTPKKRIVR